MYLTKIRPTGEMNAKPTSPRKISTITLVPGGPCLSGYLHELRDQLAAKFHVNELDLRDSRLSPVGPPFSLEGYFEDIREGLRHSEGQKILLGHSAGAVIALSFASRFPAELDGLILLNPGPLTDTAQKKFVSTVDERNRKLRPDYETTRDELAKQFAQAQGDAKSQAFLDYVSAYWPAYFTSGRAPDVFRFRLPKAEAIDPINAQYYEWKKSGEFLKTWESIRCPVLMIHGDFDPIPYEETRDLLQARIQDFDFTLIPDAGHFPWYENPAKVLSAIQSRFAP